MRLRLRQALPTTSACLGVNSASGRDRTRSMNSLGWVLWGTRQLADAQRAHGESAALYAGMDDPCGYRLGTRRASTARPGRRAPRRARTLCRCRCEGSTGGWSAMLRSSSGPSWSIMLACAWAGSRWCSPTPNGDGVARLRSPCVVHLKLCAVNSALSARCLRHCDVLTRRCPRSTVSAICQGQVRVVGRARPGRAYRRTSSSGWPAWCPGGAPRPA